ncbi:hypothetical protein GF338_00005, partial [candidate division WOR-3 bacterium]|nr:hypothetical protein [candidate division WOR-3 bacterium]
MRKLSVILIMTGVIFAGLSTDYESVTRAESDYRLLGEITDEPAEAWRYWWVGVGDFTDFTITNTTVTGYFGRSFDQYHPYSCLLPWESPADNEDGNAGEYPVGSEQYYIYAAGPWFGAISQGEPNVIKGAYRGDLGAIAVPEMSNTSAMGDIHILGLYFSNMIVPSGQGFNNEGKRVFTFPDNTPKPYQDNWPFNDPAYGRSDGEWISHEDTYAVAGDWILQDRDSLARGVWIPDTVVDTIVNGDTIYDTTIYQVYGIQPLGVRVEQRTYSWARGRLRNAVVLNYKIMNMNDHTLEAPYFSYFMDNDIGHGGENPGEDGAWDDRIDYDAAHEVVYTYDDNGSESGWNTAPGYIG